MVVSTWGPSENKTGKDVFGEGVLFIGWGKRDNKWEKEVEFMVYFNF